MVERESKSSKKFRELHPNLDPNGDLNAILGFILVNLPDRESLLGLAQGGEKISQRIGNEDWTFTARQEKRSTASDEPIYWLLMQTTDSSDQSTTYGISTDINIQTIYGMAFGPTNKEIPIGIDPLNFTETINILKSEKDKKQWAHTKTVQNSSEAVKGQIRKSPSHRKII